MEFEFQGRNSAGELIRGKRESNWLDALTDALINEGIFPISINEAKSKSASTGFSLFQKKVSVEDLLMFCRQMYTLIKSGIPIIFALTRLSETATNPKFKKALQGIAQSISSGQTLTASMQQYTKLFPNLLIQLVHVGEESGQLEKTFLQAADYLEFQSETRQRVTTVLRYPIFVILSISAAIVVINIFVIPAFAKLYGGFHVQLPLPTRILIGVANFMRKYWTYLLGALVLFVISSRSFLRTPKGKYWWGKYQLKIPIIGDILEHILLTRFSKIFGTILRAGVPLLDSLILLAASLDNEYARQRILRMSEAIRYGENLTQAAVRSELFTPTIIQMLSVGEETGSLDTMLDEVARFYEREVDYEIKRLADRIEPIIIIALSGMVLVLALGVFLPMWDMTKLIQKS